MRGKGEGSVYKRAQDGLWVASIELPGHGGARRRKLVTGKTKIIVVQKMRQLQGELQKSGDLPTASQTVETWVTYWMENIASKRLRPKTVADYRSFLTNHIIPAIGKKRLDKLTPANIRAVNDTIAQTLSDSTALKAHWIMSAAFADAEKDGRILRNPVDLVTPPRIPTATLEVLTVAEASHLIQTFGKSPEAFLWVTFMLTGARRGEILGLQWDRVTDVLDLSWQLQRHPVNMTAPVDYEHQRLQGGLYLTRPKSKAGWRIVPLVPPLQGILEQWRLRAPQNPHGLVFAMPDGSPIDPGWATKQWPKILASAGIDKKVRIHDLRHSAVDMLYEAGVPENIIQEIVGHSSRAMTRSYKSRGNRPQLTAAMTKMSELLS